MHPDLTHLENLARQAGEILRGGYGQNPAITHKGRIDLVTDYDHRSDALLTREIHARFPGHTILAEESGVHAGLRDSVWYVDPLDGTTNYAHGLPYFSVSIAYACAGSVLLAAVYNPIYDEMFTAERGRGAWLNGEALHVSQTSELLQCILATGFAYTHEVIEANLANFAHFMRVTQGVRRLGSAALDLCCVASGRVDGYWEVSVQPYDIAAGGLIAAEAGARVTALDGSPGYLSTPCSILAANEGLYEKIFEEMGKSYE
jgi:myo-inositol-1(or 4)-monophosphatase